MIGQHLQDRLQARLATTATPSRVRDWPMEGLVLVVVGLLVVLANFPFWHASLADRSLSDPNTWRFAFSTAVFLVGFHSMLVLLIATRSTVRPVLALLVLSSLVAQHMMRHYGVVLDPSMLRNALRTDMHEASELITPWFVVNIGAAIAASVLIWRIPLRSYPLRKAVTLRLSTLAGVTLAALAALLVGFQDFSSTMRNHKELRYRITPGNVVYSISRVLVADAQAAQRTAEPLLPIRKTVSVAGRKPRLLVIVVGETARAMNFSLNGYPRLTNPELSTLPVINFKQATACGTSTEVSLPCMFSSYGRAAYDEARIRSSESLVQLLDRSGMRVVWLDNQSGCKGVCTGVEFHDMTSGRDPVICPDGRCFDGILVEGLRQIAEGGAATPDRDTVVVLHQLGNHGPAYFKRHPAEFGRFKPECTKLELRECSREEIVNSYDNAILYTDHLIAATISLLQRQQDRFDVGLVYASDHGESLGEKGLYLHGMPHAIAPREQLAVPMVWWFGGSGAHGWNGLDAECLRKRADKAVHHDNLFHSMLGLMGIETASYIAERDLVSPCRNSRVSA